MPHLNEQIENEMQEQFGKGAGKSSSDEGPRVIRGTPDYIAPEVIDGLSHGQSVDWWAMGVILFEFLNGTPPFTADTKEEIFRKIVLEAPAEWSEEASPEAKDLVARLLEKDPKKRLGAGGAGEIKSHAFFSGIEWEK